MTLLLAALLAVMGLLSNPTPAHAQFLNCALALTDAFVIPTIRRGVYEAKEWRKVTVVTPISHTVISGYPLLPFTKPSNTTLFNTDPLTKLRLETAILSGSGHYHFIVDIAQVRHGYTYSNSSNAGYNQPIYEYGNRAVLNMIDLAKDFPAWTAQFGYEYKNNRLHISTTSKPKSLDELVDDKIIAGIMLPDDLRERSEVTERAIVQELDFVLHWQRAQKPELIATHLTKMYTLFRSLGGKELEFVYLAANFHLQDLAQQIVARHQTPAQLETSSASGR
jgi:hypothetical protein